ncbi:MAG: LD-carboxypeptidase [Gemmatimonadetes bacterium]|nr:LD-carboxypeptidase [Gemmatimonadota bacterium]
MIRPAALTRDARIALVAAAGPLRAEAVDRAAERVRRWGWEPLVGEHARQRTGYLAGSDEQRAADLQAAVNDPHNHAIWFLRGGYGTMRILDRIDWTPLVARPRPVIGFSDNTAIHLALQRHGLISFHGPHPAAEDLTAFAEAGVHQALTDPDPAGAIPFPAGVDQRAHTLVAGVAEGPLVGGNLSLIAATIGTPYAIRPRGAILFLEEVGEPAYRIDRLFSQLALAGVLRDVAGVAVGAISDCPDLPGDSIRETANLLLDRLAEYGVPTAFGFPFGHVPDNWTLPVGVRSRLDAGSGVLELLAGAVERRF